MTDTNKRLILTTTVSTAMIAGAFVPAAVSAANHTAESSFPDICEDTRHYDAINALYQMNIIEGHEDGYFHPDASLTRIQAALMLDRAKGLSFDGSISYDFNDVEDKYAETVDAIYEAQYFEGNEDGEFGPHEELSREQMAKVIVEAYNLPHGEGVPESSFDDRDDTRLNTYIDAVVHAGVAQGYSQDTFGTGDDIKRKDFAEMLYNAMNYTPGSDLTVTGVEVINENTISLEFSNGETFTFNLDEELAEGESTITIAIGGQEYTVDVNYNPDVPDVVNVTPIDEDTIEVELSTGETVTIDLDQPLDEGDNTIVINIGGEDYTVDVNYEVEAPEIDEVTAIDENTIEVVLSNGETVTVDLDEPLDEGNNTITIIIDDEDYTIDVNFDSPILTVEVATAIDEDTIEVELSNGETVTVDLDEPLDEGDNTITITIDDVDYTVDVTFDPDVPVLDTVEAVDENTIEITWQNGTSIEVDLDENLTVGENNITFEVDGNAYTATVLYYPESEFFVTAETAATINSDNVANVPFSGDTYPGSEVSIELEDESNNTLTVSTEDGDFVLEDGSFATTVDASALEDGTVEYTVTSDYETWTTETTGSFELDTTAPEFNLLDLNVTADGLEFLTVTEPGAEISVEAEDGTVLAVGTADDSGELTLELLENLDEADLTNLTVQVTDGNDNTTTVNVNLIENLEQALTDASDGGLLSGGVIEGLIGSDGLVDLSGLIDADGTLSLDALLEVDGIIDLGNINLLETA